MARIRSIKPEFPQSESMGKVSRESRLCFILLWTLADDAGRLRGNSRMLASLLYPYDDDAKKYIDGWLAELTAQDCIVRYAIDGESFIQIRKWAVHQKIDKPSPSKIPEFDEPSRTFANPRESSPTPREDSAADLGREGIKERKGRDRSAREGSLPDIDPTVAFAEVDPQVLADWLAIRKKKKAGLLTQTAVDGILAEIAKAGISTDEALRICCRRNWIGFDNSWGWRGNGQGAPPNGNGMTAYQQMQVEKHVEDKRIREAIHGKPTEQPIREPIDITPRRVG